MAKYVIIRYQEIPEIIKKRGTKQWERQQTEVQGRAFLEEFGGTES